MTEVMFGTLADAITDDIATLERWIEATELGLLLTPTVPCDSEIAVLAGARMLLAARLDPASWPAHRLTDPAEMAAWAARTRERLALLRRPAVGSA